MTKRLLFVVRSTEYFRSHRLPLANELLRRGFEVGLAATIIDDEASTYLSNFGIKLHNVCRTDGPVTGLRAMFDIFSAIRSFRPQIIHVISPMFILYAVLINTIFRVPIVVVFAGLGTLFKSGKILHKIGCWMFCLLVKNALRLQKYHIVFMNHDDQREFHAKTSIPLRASQVILGSGVDLRRYRPRESVQREHLTVGFAGRLLRDKGILEFIDAVKYFRDFMPNVQFCIAGDIDEGNSTTISSAMIEEMCASLRNLTWLGKVNNFESVLENWDIFCFPSYHEGLSLALLEAAAVGCALVVSDIPGNRVVVKNEDFGWLFESRNSEALRTTLVECVNSRSERLAKATKSQEFVRNYFGIESVAQKYVDVYSKLS